MALLSELDLISPSHTHLLELEAEDRIFFESGEFIDLSYLASIGVENSIDTNSYAVYLTFDNEDMPIQILSLRPTGSFATRPIAGALNVYPAAFTWSARYTLSLSFGVNSLERFVSTLRGRFTVQNYLRLYDVYGSFSYYFDYYNRALYRRYVCPFFNNYACRKENTR